MSETITRTLTGEEIQSLLGATAPPSSCGNLKVAKEAEGFYLAEDGTLWDCDYEGVRMDG